MPFKKGQKGYWTGKKRGPRTDAEKKKISRSMRGFKAHQWKGQKASYREKHWWIRKWYGKPPVCEHCGLKDERPYKIQWANKTGKYLRNRNDWLRLCIACHIKYDER